MVHVPPTVHWHPLVLGCSLELLKYCTVHVLLLLLLSVSRCSPFKLLILFPAGGREGWDDTHLVVMQGTSERMTDD